MERRLKHLQVLGYVLLMIAFSVLPVQAQQNVKDEIQSLKSRLAELETQQIEMQKEATEAAAALPTFSYRPGNGLLIEAANKSWSLRSTMEAHLRWLFESGRDQVGRTQGEVMGRRFRPFWYFCVNNCLWEIETGLDLDASPTGNVDGDQLQRGAVHFHMENMNPWLPTLTAGMDISTSAAATISRQGSSATGAQREYDILSREVGPNTGSSANGLTLTWDDRALTGIGIPGRISRIQFGMANVGEGGDGSSRISDRKSFTGYIGIEPFRSLKNKWIRGLLFEFGAWACNVDGNPAAENNGHCTRLRLRDHGDLAKQPLFDTGANSMGKGTFRYMSPGIAWIIGPYRLRAMGGWINAEDGVGVGGVATPGKKRAHNFLIGHDLYIWSPKGFLTGNANTPGSILLGYHFERNDASCGDRTRPCNVDGTLGEFRRNRVILNEWDAWYVIMPRMSVGLSFLWYDASNLETGRDNAGHNLGVFKNNGAATPGTGGDWVDWSLTWRYAF